MRGEREPNSAGREGPKAGARLIRPCAPFRDRSPTPSKHKGLRPASRHREERAAGGRRDERQGRPKEAGKSPCRGAKSPVARSSPSVAHPRPGFTRPSSPSPGGRGRPRCRIGVMLRFGPLRSPVVTPTLGAGPTASVGKGGSPSHRATGSKPLTSAWALPSARSSTGAEDGLGDRRLVARLAPAVLPRERSSAESAGGADSPPPQGSGEPSAAKTPDRFVPASTKPSRPASAVRKSPPDRPPAAGLLSA